METILRSIIEIKFIKFARGENLSHAKRREAGLMEVLKTDELKVPLIKIKIRSRRTRLTREKNCCLQKMTSLFFNESAFNQVFF